MCAQNVYDDDMKKASEGPQPEAPQSEPASSGADGAKGPEAGAAAEAEAQVPGAEAGASDEPITDDEWWGFRKLSEEEQKWALIQLQLDREQKYLEGLYSQE